MASIRSTFGAYAGASDQTVAGDLEERRPETGEAITDVLICALLLAHDTGVDPAEKAKGSRVTYPES